MKKNKRIHKTEISYNFNERKSFATNFFPTMQLSVFVRLNDRTRFLKTEFKIVYSGFKPLYSHFGGDSNEDPPVLIPNTEVKLVYAESTNLDTDWEDRKLPDFKKRVDRY